MYIHGFQGATMTNPKDVPRCQSPMLPRGSESPDPAGHGDEDSDRGKD